MAWLGQMIILHTLHFVHSTEDAHTIFRDAAAHNMTEAGHVWIVTEQALNANNTPDGVLGLQLLYANSEKEHIRVSVVQTNNAATESADSHWKPVGLLPAELLFGRWFAAKVSAARSWRTFVRDPG